MLPVSREIIRQDISRAEIVENLATYKKAAAGAFAENTTRAIRADTRVFAEWCAGAGRSAQLPVSPDTVAAFIDAMSESRRPATVSRYVSSLNHLHRAAGLPEPKHSQLVTLALRRIKRARGTRQAQAAALTRDRVDRILACLGDSLSDLRDAALITLAYDTLARRSELAALDIEHIAWAEYGTGMTRS